MIVNNNNASNKNIKNINVPYYLNNTINNQKANNKEEKNGIINNDKNDIKINGKNDVPIINIIDNKTNSKSIKDYKKEIFNIIDKKVYLELEDKNKIIDIFSDAEKNNVFSDLIMDLHKNKKLEQVYKSLGTLVNQSEAGTITSVFLALFTLGISSISEAKMNRAYDLKNMMEKNNIPKEIINNLK
ncbi:MAG: hypothetical protein KatS3mg068_0891 [Candidatus Sericytochromatia bacterium]|nr:MAG: hypothetical protein KatS3mg068_0891 [Candidatus Sericytochromatia bacterium]